MGVPIVAQHITNLTSIHEDVGLAQWIKDWAVSCGVGGRHHSDPSLLWLRLAAVALIGLLAWELHAPGVGLKKKKKKKNLYTKEKQTEKQKKKIMITKGERKGGED